MMQEPHDAVKNQRTTGSGGDIKKVGGTNRERDIQSRTFGFAVRILRMVKAVPKDAAGQIVARQLARSGTSIGANVEEAQGAQSRLDFARKMNIALSEAREPWYWLRLIAESGMISATRLTALIQEANEIVKILTTIVKRSRQSGKGKVN